LPAFQDDALVEQGIRSRAGAAGRGEARRQLGGFRARLGSLVELPLRVVDGRQPVPRGGVVRLDLGGHLVRGFGLVVLLLLCVGEPDVVVAVVALRVDLDAGVELFDRLVVPAGVAGGDAFLEQTLQVGRFGGELLRVGGSRRGGGSADHEVDGRRPADFDSHFLGARSDFVFLGLNRVPAAAQPDLQELTFAIGLDRELAPGVGHDHGDGGALDRFVLDVEYDAANRAAGLRRHRCGNRQNRQRQ
jgi:hypothetical protein